MVIESGRKGLQHSNRVFLTGVSFILSLSAGLQGCAGLTDKGGVFEDRSQQYREAQSLDTPLSSKQVRGSYEPDPLYPVPDQVKGAIVTKTPRVTKAFIPLEQGAVALIKSTSIDKVVFSDLYKPHLKRSILDYLKNRELSVLKAGSAREETALSGLKSSREDRPWSDVVVTQWVSDKQLGYSEPGFFRRLFGARAMEHQFAYVLEDLHKVDTLGDYSVQLTLAHQARQVGSKSPKPWSWSMDEDVELGEHLVEYVDFVRREVALASAGDRSQVTANLEVDGNGLPYLAISDRFAFVWETMLDVIPQKQWKIEDLDRSQGIVFLSVRKDKLLSSKGQEEFHLHLTEGPQMMTLSVEINENDPANAQIGRHVLTLLQERFLSEFGSSMNE